MADHSHTSAQEAAGEGQVLGSLHGPARTAASRPVGDEPADELVALRREIELLRGAAGEAVVEQAKGALMLRYGIDSDRAHGVLVGWSRDCNIDVHTLADALVVVCTGAHHGTEPTVLRWIEEHLRRDPKTDRPTPSPMPRRG